ncbi:hypothetical protein BKA67DRAFT_197000 [Truncatella angustata]|uniref:Uncharacterized protein n=1 Tax=Truncatella angustata TaxID=152316 RepID=A0A9P8URP5_9PEZI|nr:uncharacterized protein BKA67DRAFT_197000 [Truncatella angustata]KAH6657745.1 hypothetical protein BKA67DRAFT_197000 [Truncatella angustata]
MFHDRAVLFWIGPCPCIRLRELSARRGLDTSNSDATSICHAAIETIGSWSLAQSSLACHLTRGTSLSKPAPRRQLASFGTCTKAVAPQETTTEFAVKLHTEFLAYSTTTDKISLHLTIAQGLLDRLIYHPCAGDRMHFPHKILITKKRSRIGKDLGCFVTYCSYLRQLGIYPCLAVMCSILPARRLGHMEWMARWHIHLTSHRGSRQGFQLIDR